MITFPLFDMSSILEQMWYLIKEVGFTYNDINQMPFEELEWFYNREIQYQVDMQKSKQTGTM